MSILHFIIGLATGVLSGFGIGGGSLLVVYLTALAGVEQTTAAGINLLYFLGCAPAALCGHIRHKKVEWKPALWCILAGVITATVTALLTKNLDTELLHRLFGGVLIYIGIRELTYSKKNK